MELDFEQIVGEILRRKKLGRDELMGMIKRKQDELSGFVTLEGAAIIVGRELGVELARKESEIKQLRLEDIVPGMSNVDIVGRVLRVYEPRVFERQDGRTARVGSFIIMDQTGQARVVLWDDKSSLIDDGEIKKGKAIEIRGAYVRQGADQRPELHVGLRGSIILEPEDSRVKDLPQIPERKVNISDLKPGLKDIDIAGRVVAVSEPRTFERPDGTAGRVLTMMIMDQTGRTRVSIWDEKVELAKGIKRGDVVMIENAQVKEGMRGRPEIYLDWRGRILLNMSGPEVENLPKLAERPLKVEEIEADMPVLDFVGRVRRKFQPQEFRRDDGRTGKVVSLILADETGIIRTSFWNGMAEVAEKVSTGDVIFLKNAYTRAGLAGNPEIQVGKMASVEINPPGLEVGEPGPTVLKIGEIEPDMDAIEVVGRVVETSGPKRFLRSDGSEGVVSTVRIGDLTGTIRVSLWQEQADIKEISVGDIVKFTNCYSTIGLFGHPEIHLNKNGGIEINPEVGEEFPPADLLAAARAPERTTIESLQKEGVRAQIRGTIVRVFRRRPLFDVCPICGRSLGSVDSSLLCEECGKVVKPEHRVVLSFVVDDGTDNMRAVAFGKIAEGLIGMSAQQVFELFKQSDGLTELYQKFDLTGREVLLTGTTKYDKYFDQLEFRVADFSSPDPKEEARLLLEAIKASKL
ncbi:MAG: hypothetical protein APU95_00210 [Hadesarchaea archaeon YNP_N21]|nr:MAG: hypothetical protein APU95_00210 [Hadesarchaea archaeon YNP_N21]